LGYAEAATGIGLMIGPVIGGPIYDGVGYFWSFVVFAGMLFISMLVVFLITPGSLNTTTD